MIYTPQRHVRRTAQLARSINKPKEIYKWFVTKGYFPEPYVLPPCFVVTKYPKYGKQYTRRKKRKYEPSLSEFQKVHFPKTELTDRTFGIIDPTLHSDIAYEISKHWDSLIKLMLGNKVCSYSFPIPLDAKTPGEIGKLVGGRMIYEFIEMAENDIASIAYQYNYLFKTDLKNFYPSIYTHSIAWAIHGKMQIRAGRNRSDFKFVGNRLDKLFQYANDQCTNGIPIGPAVSDFIAELILSAIDREISKKIKEDVCVVRFKDDYRILSKTEESGRAIIKHLQSALRDYKLELNDEKTELYKLPSGIFRNWVSEYHLANPHPKRQYYFKKFKEVYLSVIRIDQNNPGCGVIDKFLSDIVKKNYTVRISLTAKSLPKVISLLFMLARLRIKSFPKVLAIIESILNSTFGKKHIEDISRYLEDYLRELQKREMHNRYLISWVCYFIHANNLQQYLRKKYIFKDPIIQATYTGKPSIFVNRSDFSLFVSAKKISKQVSMLEHLDVFKPQ